MKNMSLVRNNSRWKESGGKIKDRVLCKYIQRMMYSGGVEETMSSELKRAITKMILLFVRYSCFIE